MQEGLADMQDARRDKATDEHNVIDDAIQDRGEGYTVFSIVGNLFCPPLCSILNVYLARWSSLSTIGEKAEEFGYKGLHGESGTVHTI